MRAVCAFMLLLASCKPKLHPQLGTERGIVDEGHRRTYFVHGPEHDTGPRRPLVIVLHGRYGDGLQVEAETGFTPAAERAGFVVAYPSGVDRAWHDRRDLGAAVKVDDVGFIASMIDDLVRDRNVDPKRVYIAGFSNGAMMAFRLACELSEKVGAIATVAGTLPINGADDCRPKHPMPLLMFAGTQDPFVPYAGGAIANKRGNALGVEATRDRFAALNGCAPMDVTHTIDRVMNDDTYVTETAYTHCANEAEVRLYSIVGGGHTWPNGPAELSMGMAGRTTRELDGAGEMLRFFAQH